jgi:RNA polymerase sigma-70 factor (ECF subfamily)
MGKELQQTDISLNEIKKNNPVEIEKLYRRYHDMVLGYFKRRFPNDRDTAEELADSFWCITLSNIKHIKIHTLIEGYLLGICNNHLNSHLRRKYGEQEKAKKYRESQASNLASNRSMNSTDVEQRERVMSCVQRLKPIYQTVIRLYYTEGHKIAQIAQDLNLSESYVKVLLHKAREELRGMLE